MDIKIPFLGDGIDSATVIEVLVSPGDTVAVDDTLAELETDKATAPVPSTAAGVIESIQIKSGDTVSQGMLVATLKSDGASASATPKAAPAAATPAQPTPAPTPVQAAPVTATASSAYQYVSSTGSPPPTSPSIRKMAHQTGLDLARIQGTGNGGRITIEDVRAHMTMLQARAFAPAASSPAAPAPASSAPSTPAAKPLPDFSKFGSIRKEAMSSLRQKIASNLHSAWNRIPHVTQFHDADITDLMTMRKKAVPKYEKKKARLTVTVFLLKAIVETLKKHPQFNASYDEATQEMIYKEYYHIGMAVDTDNGLIVPVIRDVDKKSMLELSLELADISERARDRKIGLEDIQGASFTLSNLGGLGVGQFTPIVNHPEVAILGVGRGGLKPVQDGKEVVYRSTMPLSLSYDHRVIDGANGARFIYDLAQSLESFDASLLKE